MERRVRNFTTPVTVAIHYNVWALDREEHRHFQGKKSNEDRVSDSIKHQLDMGLNILDRN